VAMVHDEIVIESAKDFAPDVAQVMEQAMLQAGKEIVPNIPIPGDVKITDKWSKK
jgi:DNA polymerase I-like protein with 3'-5' exonuclease and polymerase domains